MHPPVGPRISSLFGIVRIIKVGLGSPWTIHIQPTFTSLKSIPSWKAFESVPPESHHPTDLLMASWSCVCVCVRHREDASDTQSIRRVAPGVSARDILDHSLISSFYFCRPDRSGGTAGAAPRGGVLPPATLSTQSFACSV